MYTVYGKAQSRAFRVTWMLEEIGEPYQMIEAGPHSPEVLAVNPAGKIPILQDGDAIIRDSTAILTYLADKHGQLTFPAGTIERAQQDAMTHAILDELDAVLWAATRHVFILPEDKRVPGLGDSMKWEFARNLKGIDSRMQGPFVMGDKMTITDIVLAHCLNWAFGAKFPIENDAMLAYSKSMRQRDAFQRAAVTKAD